MVLERGAGYCTVSIKGLEFQEISCYIVEVVRFDDIFEEVFFEKFGCFFNQYLLYTLALVDIELVKIYLDVRNVLIGIIDQLGSFDIVMSLFIKSLVWVLLYRVNQLKIKEKKKNFENVSKGVGSENNNNLLGRILKVFFYYNDRVVIVMEIYVGRLLFLK